MKNFNQFLFRINETVIETKNIANPGDWIIKAKTQAGEEYVVKGAKFPKLYDENSASKPVDPKISENGFMEYKVIPEERVALICDRKILDELKQKLGAIDKTKPFDQQTILNVMNYFKNNFIKVRKKSSAYAKKVDKPVEVITRVQKGKPEEIWFAPSWGGSMPISENDILIVNDKEVYRVARSEFDQTYNI